MELKDDRKGVVEYGKKLYLISIWQKEEMAIYQFLIEKEITIAISPRGMDYFETKPENIVLINLDGNIIEGLRKPSSEAKMHILIYKNRSDANSVVHTHSTFATTLQL